MLHTVTTYFDFASPFAYLGATQIGELCRRQGADLTWHPVLLGAIFKEVGTPLVPVMSFSEAKRRHVILDLARYAHQWEVPFRWPSRFPMRTIAPLRLVLAAQADAPAHAEALILRIFRAYWVEDRDIAQPPVLSEVMQDLGLDAQGLLARTADPAIKQALFARNEEAVEAGVFGVPTFLVDGRELIWGQDRLHLVEWTLAEPAPAA